jgi:hypothetical protein
MLTMLEPNTFPIAMPMFSGLTGAKTETLRLGKEVQNPIKTKPTVVFPMPVISEILIECFIVNSLAKTRTANAASRTPMLPIKPISSNSSVHLSAQLVLGVPMIFLCFLILCED